MPEQLVTHCPFFALRPSPPDASRSFRLGQKLRSDAGLNGRITSADRLHISLHGFGHHPYLPERLMEAACEAGEAVSFPEFDVTFDCAGSFRSGASGKAPFVLRSRPELDAPLLFHRVLAAAMTRAGLRRRLASRFTPHMTLLYDHRVARQREIETVRFRVREFVLLDSLVGRSRHVPVACWQLKG